MSGDSPGEGTGAKKPADAPRLVEAVSPVRRPPRPSSRSRKKAPSEKSGAAGAPEKEAPKSKATRNEAQKKQAQKKQAQKKQAQKKKAQKNKAASASGRSTAGATSDAPSSVATDSARPSGMRHLLIRPDTNGPKVRLGILWFLVALGGVIWGRWATVAIWAVAAALAAHDTANSWGASRRSEALAPWASYAAAGAAALCVGAAGFGTGLGGIAIAVVPLALVGLLMVGGRKPADAGGPLIGVVLAAIPAVSVVLVVRTEQWAAIFLIAAVSLYDAGYFVGGAESSSRLEGPATGIIGLLAVTFAASAIEAAPFDRLSAWVVGVVLAVACPLGQMIVSAELPAPDAAAAGMRRLDTYVVAAPLMLAAAWIVS